jgi:Sec-independent protein translocase protein TatA
MVGLPSVGVPELPITLMVILGAGKLPDIGGGLGQAIGDLPRATEGLDLEEGQE